MRLDQAKFLWPVIGHHPKINLRLDNTSKEVSFRTSFLDTDFKSLYLVKSKVLILTEQPLCTSKTYLQKVIFSRVNEDDAHNLRK